MSHILNKLRKTDVLDKVGTFEKEINDRSMEEFMYSGVKFAASHSKIENAYYNGVRRLIKCIVPSVAGTPLLHEGGGFDGCWLESTGSISTELLSRFFPKVAQSCFEIFADFIREDGLLPYKLISDGPSHRQIQMVTPFARCVWNHYLLNGRDKKFLDKMYHAISRNDKWLATNRNTRGTGCVEAFCTFDTGNDASPRFWHVTDTPFMGDAAQYDPDSPILPFLAPDLTANVYCQRKYLKLMANELEIDDTSWDEKAEHSLNSLMTYCYDEKDKFFYDLDNNEHFVRVQSVVLLRVMASEVGDDAMFEDALSRYLLNTKKFFCRYPLATMAMDDPGYFQSTEYNTWSGHVSFLSEIRIPHAFEYHHRYVELSWILQPIITALSRFKKFAGSTCSWIGNEGYSENYSPTMLCFLDFLERLCGILPTPQGELWFTALIPYGIDYGEIVAEETAYSRTVDEIKFELINEQDGSSVYKNEKLLYTIPKGVRLVTDRTGELKALIGMSVRTIKGEIQYKEDTIPFSVSGNERLELVGNKFVSVDNPGVVMPRYGPIDS